VRGVTNSRARHGAAIPPRAAVVRIASRRAIRSRDRTRDGHMIETALGHRAPDANVIGEGR
jgi:hypothetical protein